MPASKIKDNAAKMGFLLPLILLVNVSLSQEFPVVEAPGNKNLKLTVKVITIKAKHFIIPNLKVLLDTQNIKIYRETTYGNETDPIVDCRFFLKKIIKNQSVNMYVIRSYYQDLDSHELIKFTTKDSLTDTICIENFIPLEPGQYIVSLEFSYYLNGVKDIIYSDETGFFIKPPKPTYSARNKRSKKRHAASR